MLQTLFYIPNEIAGWPVFGFGLVLALWTVASVVLVAWLVRKQGLVADTWGYLPILLAMGAVIAWVLPMLCEPQGLPIRGYGMMILLAVVSGIGLAAWRARRSGANPEMVVSLAFWMILPGIVGARAFYVTEYWSEQYWPVYQQNGLLALLGAIISLNKGGLVVYGSLFGGIAGLVWFWRKHRIPLLATADLLVPSLALGAGLGRIGCLLNGCCFGAECDLPWHVTFPWNSPAHAHQVYEGEAFVAGLKLAAGGPDGVLVREVEPGSPADLAGLRPGDEIREINGIPVLSVREGLHDACWALLTADKLHLIVPVPGDLPLIWTVDDPPVKDSAPRGTIQIYGLEIGGGGKGGDEPVIVKVRPQSAEQRFKLKPGQRIARLNGRAAPTLASLRDLLAEHRAQPWLRLDVAGRAAPVELLVPEPLPRSLPVHPTQVYSILDGLLLCLVLLVFSRFARRDGAVFALGLTIYPITRFLIERLRADEPPIFGTGMHISQNISLGVLVIAAGLWAYILRQPPRARGIQNSKSQITNKFK